MRRRKHRKYTVEQPAPKPRGNQLRGSTTQQHQHPHIYGLLDIVTPTTTLSPPEVTSTALDDVIATTTTTTAATRTVAVMHHSCVCSCHETGDFSTMDAAGNERSSETYVERYVYNGGETDCRHLHYHHQTPQPSSFRIHSSSMARRASTSETESMMLEVQRPLWMSNSSAGHRCDCIH